VVSNADPQVTLRGLVGEEHLGLGTRSRLALSRWSVSSVSLYLAVDMDLDAMGYDAGNYWYNRTPDIEATYRVERGAGSIDQDELPGLFLTITTMKDPTKRRGGTHTMEAFAFVPYDTFRPYAGSVTGARPPGYEELKKRVAATMLRTAERVIPGLSRHVTFMELGTPLTNVHYLAAHGGNVYGIEKNRFQIGPFAYPIETDVPGLLMCGASTTGHGVMGATLSGMAAAAKVLRCNPRDLLKNHGQTLRTARSDDPTTWPEGTRRPESARERSRLGMA
jgi:phytoene dehydrogenase-like protein